MPSFAAAAAVLLARHVLSQMDVPTRQAYTMALVAPEERPAAAGLTASARALAQACGPVVSGLTMAAAATPLPFLLAGGLKIVYDLEPVLPLPLGSPRRPVGRRPGLVGVAADRRPYARPP